MPHCLAVQQPAFIVLAWIHVAIGRAAAYLPGSRVVPGQSPGLWLNVASTSHLGSRSSGFFGGLWSILWAVPVSRSTPSHAGRVRRVA
jgi:hypothetical protein